MCAQARTGFNVHYKLTIGTMRTRHVSQHIQIEYYTYGTPFPLAMLRMVRGASPFAVSVMWLLPEGSECVLLCSKLLRVGAGMSTSLRGSFAPLL
mmetsp:Transcript_8019/g.29642  ORF Transcript_8019/g.29642 Transcript_8019/m.29642 type:complete len:95 (-) Transcript_8019:3370-3654(-)